MRKMKILILCGILNFIYIPLKVNADSLLLLKDIESEILESETKKSFKLIPEKKEKNSESVGKPVEFESERNYKKELEKVLEEKSFTNLEESKKCNSNSVCFSNSLIEIDLKDELELFKDIEKAKKAVDKRIDKHSDALYIEKTEKIIYPGFVKNENNNKNSERVPEIEKSIYFSIKIYPRNLNDNFQRLEEKIQRVLKLDIKRVNSYLVVKNIKKDNLGVYTKFIKSLGYDEVEYLKGDV